MARLIALEWDSREARVAVGHSTGRNVVVEAALSIALSDSQDEAADGLADRLADACQPYLGARVTLLVGVPRSRVEVRMLQIPPAPEAELPDMVRFQAMRQFASLGEDWPLDFVPLSAPNGVETTPVLATAIAPETVAGVRRVCARLDVQPAKLILRSFGTASLLSRARPEPACRLLVESLGDETELTIVNNEQVLFLRSVRLPVEDTIGALGRELRRTVAAAENQLGHLDVQSVVLLGSDDELLAEQESMSKAVPWPVEILDPFAVMECQASLQDQLPANRGRFASVLGMLVGAVEPARMDVDFLAPRKRPEPPNRTRTYSLLGAAVAAVLLLLVSGVAYRVHAYNSDLAQLQEQSKSCDAPVEAAKQTAKEAAAVDEFVAGSPNWLDELYELSQEFPSTEKAIVDQATFSVQKGGGQIRLKGRAAETTVINEMERDLTDSLHRVTGTGSVFDERQTEFPWSFEETIHVLPRDIEETENE